MSASFATTTARLMGSSFVVNVLHIRMYVAVTPTSLELLWAKSLENARLSPKPQPSERTNTPTNLNPKLNQTKPNSPPSPPRLNACERKEKAALHQAVHHQVPATSPEVSQGHRAQQGVLHGVHGLDASTGTISRRRGRMDGNSKKTEEFLALVLFRGERVEKYQDPTGGRGQPSLRGIFGMGGQKMQSRRKTRSHRSSETVNVTVRPNFSVLGTVPSALLAALRSLELIHTSR